MTSFYLIYILLRENNISTTGRGLVRKKGKVYYDLEKAETGGEFYHILETIMGKYLENHKMSHTKHGEITRADMAASLMFSKFGIPGLRFWDRLSRNKQEGTHNFVIWREDLIKILGFEGDALKFAKQLKESGQEEIYNQLAGKKAAERFAELGNPEILNNLQIAEEMLKAGKDDKTIWLATGWWYAPDKGWRFQLNYGDFKKDGFLSEEEKGIIAKRDKISRLQNYVSLFDQPC